MQCHWTPVTAIFGFIAKQALLHKALSGSSHCYSRVRSWDLLTLVHRLNNKCTLIHQGHDGLDCPDSVQAIFCYFQNGIHSLSIFPLTRIPQRKQGSSDSERSWEEAEPANICDSLAWLLRDLLLSTVSWRSWRLTAPLLLKRFPEAQFWAPPLLVFQMCRV
jgi:hypothetical protein